MQGVLINLDRIVSTLRVYVCRTQTPPPQTLKAETGALSRCSQRRTRGPWACLSTYSRHHPPPSLASPPIFSVADSDFGELGSETQVWRAGNPSLNMETQGTVGPTLLPQTTGCFRTNCGIPAAGGRLRPAPPGFLHVATYFVALRDKTNKNQTSNSSLSRTILRRELGRGFFGGGG